MIKTNKRNERVAMPKQSYAEKNLSKESGCSKLLLSAIEFTLMDVEIAYSILKRYKNKALHLKIDLSSRQRKHESFDSFDITDN